MRRFRDAKMMARSLRAGPARSGIAIPHSRALEIVAARFGLPDWNVLAARIGAAGDPGPGAGSLRLDPGKRAAFRAAVMAALAEAPGGLSPADLADRVRERVPEAMRGGGLRWRVTAAGLDLEAQGHVARRRRGHAQIRQASPDLT